MTTFPVHDWQFWVVTSLALCAVIFLAWQVIPRALGRKGKARKATLTIGGKPVGTAEASSRITNP